MKILSNKKYNSLVEKANKICTTTTYYLNNPYQTKTIEKLEDKNVELEIQVDKLKKKFKKTYKKYVDIRDKKISELLRENEQLKKELQTLKMSEEEWLDKSLGVDKE